MTLSLVKSGLHSFLIIFNFTFYFINADTVQRMAAHQMAWSEASFVQMLWATLRLFKRNFQLVFFHLLGKISI